METARCRAFVSSVEEGTFSAAADKLGYTPSGVSQLVTAFEDELGFPLLIRTHKGVHPTAGGDRLLPAVREFLAQEDRIRQLADDVCGLVTGKVTVAAYSSISSHWLPGIYREFKEKYPGIEIDIMEGIRQEVDGWLRGRQADLAFMTYLEPMGYEWIPLAEDPMLAVLPNDHPKAKKKKYQLKDVEHDNFIMPALGKDDDVAAMFGEYKITPNITMTTLENFSAISMIEQGLGVSVMNKLITENWECNVTMLPIDPPYSITFGIALPSIKNASPAVRRFIDFAVKRLTRSAAQEG